MRIKYEFDDEKKKKEPEEVPSFSHHYRSIKGSVILK